MVQSVSGLVEAAARGDQAAWNALVDRYNGLVWSVARGFGLSATDAADVAQTTWLRLVERLSTIRDPERVGAWLATTARNECRQTLRRGGRQIPTDDDYQLEPREPDEAPVDAQVLTAERDDALWQAVDALSDACRRLVRVLMADPAPSYEEVGAALDMPVGSIGPTRRRCLERLRGLVDATGLAPDCGGAG